MYTISSSIYSKVNIADAPVSALIEESEGCDRLVSGQSNGHLEPELQVRFERFCGQRLCSGSTSPQSLKPKNVALVLLKRSLQ
jgi:hypothetical protein